MKCLWVLPFVLAEGCDAGFGPEFSFDGTVGAGGTAVTNTWVLKGGATAKTVGTGGTTVTNTSSGMGGNGGFGGVSPSANCDGAWKEEWIAMEEGLFDAFNAERRTGGDCGATRHLPTNEVLRDPILTQVARVGALKLALGEAVTEVELKDWAVLLGFKGNITGWMIDLQLPTGRAIIDSWKADTALLCPSLYTRPMNRSGVAYIATPGAAREYRWATISGQL